jgi:hypothetical protein
MVPVEDVIDVIDDDEEEAPVRQRIENAGASLDKRTWGGRTGSREAPWPATSDSCGF